MNLLKLINQNLSSFCVKHKILFKGFLFTLPILIMAFVIFKQTSNSVAKDFDVNWGYPWNIGVLLFFLLGIVLNFKDLIAPQNHIASPKWSVGILSAFLIFITWFATSNIRMQHRVLSDESSWISMAQQMHHNFNGAVCNQGVFEDGGLDCQDKVNNFKGKALSLAYVLAFQFFPANRDTALYVNLILFLLSLVFIYYATLLRWKSPWLSLTTMLFLGTMPKLLFQSRSASTEVMHIFLMTLLLVFIQVLPRAKFRWKQWLIIMPIMGVLSQTRQETLFCFLAISLYYLPVFSKKQLAMPSWVLGLLLSCIPMVAVIAGYKGYNFQGGEHDTHSAYNLYLNFWENIKVLLNWESGYQGLLKYPYSTTVTVIILLGILSVLWDSLHGKRVKEALFGLFFFIQPIIIMINVSGNFNIDINQRYVLVILPFFAICAALFIQRIANAFFAKKPSIAYALTSGGLILLLMYHQDSFQANIHYKGNKLLEEELFLNKKLKEFPEKSIFIYARPWQLITSEFNTFSEGTFLGWSESERKKWRDYSSNNIYLVRGQDGYGKVDKKSKVVGFKTTAKIERILKEFQIDRLFSQTKIFGYPLSIAKIGQLKGSDPFANKIRLSSPNKIKDRLIFSLNLGFNDPVAIRLLNPVKKQLTAQASYTDTLVNLPRGSFQLHLQIEMPNGKTKDLQRWVFNEARGAKLITALPRKSTQVGWGTLKENRSIENNTLKNNGEDFPFGLGSHTPSKIEYYLGKKFNTLHAFIGLDDESMCGDGTKFYIYGDGVKLFSSQHLYAMQRETVKLDIHGVETISLQSEELENDLCDHSDWLMVWVN